MSDKTNRIPIKEFRELGWIQEINRRLLHPAGLALEVIVDDDGTERLGGIWDFRDLPAGVRFDDGELEIEKGRSVLRAMAIKQGPRHKTLGYVIQPLEEEGG